VSESIRQEFVYVFTSNEKKNILIIFEN